MAKDLQAKLRPDEMRDASPNDRFNGMSKKFGGRGKKKRHGRKSGRK